MQMSAKSLIWNVEHADDLELTNESQIKGTFIYRCKRGCKYGRLLIFLTEFSMEKIRRNSNEIKRIPMNIIGQKSEVF